MTIDFVSVEAEKVRNYWIAKAGANANKRDWTATWRNWIFSTRFGRSFETTRRAATGLDAILTGLLASLNASIRDEYQRARTGSPEGSDVTGHPDLGGRSTR